MGDGARIPVFHLPSSRAAIQSGVALRLPPHSKTAGTAIESSPSHRPFGSNHGRCSGSVRVKNASKDFRSSGGNASNPVGMIEICELSSDTMSFR
jgi:hypothetical protein